MLLTRLAIATGFLFLACTAYVWAQPDPDVLDALRHMQRAEEQLSDSLSEADRRQQIAQWIARIIREGKDAVAELRTALDDYEWANNPAKVILGVGQDILGGLFPFLAIGAGMRERNWRKKTTDSGKAEARQDRAPDPSGPQAEDPEVTHRAHESQRSRKVSG